MALADHAAISPGIMALKQQVKEANAASREERAKRGHKPNPRILDARAAGANI